jgi:hypothetical protein
VLIAAAFLSLVGAVLGEQAEAAEPASAVEEEDGAEPVAAGLPQGVGDVGAHWFGDGGGVAFRGGVRLTHLGGFHAGVLGGVSVLYTMHRHVAVAGHGRFVVGGTIDPRPRARVRSEFVVGGGFESFGPWTGGRGGRLGGARLFFGSRLTVLGLLPKRGVPRRAVGGYFGWGLAYGRAGDVVGPLPFLELGVTIEAGVFGRTGLRRRSSRE